MATCFIANMRLMVYLLATWIITATGTLSEPDEYILDQSFNTGDNYLNISYDNETKSNNYFIVIGDWGASLREILPGLSGAKICNDNSQKKVGEEIKKFITEQEKKNKTLLFFVLVGDNFYYKGNDGSDTAWTEQWKSIYGTKYTEEYYWFSVMGNHDWLDNDPHAMCPWTAPKHNFTYNISNKITVMPYASNQLSKSKGGTAPEYSNGGYYMPEYSYYYTINDLNLELIMLDTNGLHQKEIYWDIGGNVPWPLPSSVVSMGSKSYKNCGDGDRDHLEGIARKWLQKLSNASYDMMIARAKNSKNTNFILAQHYPQEGESWLNDFNTIRTNYSLNANDIVVSVYGHTHDQHCDGNATDPWGDKYCNRVLTGGGGGCCDVPLGIGDSNGLTRGYYVFDFDVAKDVTRLHQPYYVSSATVESKFNCGKSWVFDITEFDINTQCPIDQRIAVSDTFGFCNVTTSGIIDTYTTTDSYSTTEVYTTNETYTTTTVEEADGVSNKYSILWLGIILTTFFVL